MNVSEEQMGPSAPSVVLFIQSLAGHYKAERLKHTQNVVTGNVSADLQATTGVLRELLLLRNRPQKPPSPPRSLFDRDTPVGATAQVAEGGGVAGGNEEGVVDEDDSDDGVDDGDSDEDDDDDEDEDYGKPIDTTKRMELLRSAMGIPDIGLHKSNDTKKDHPRNECSDGVTVIVGDDELKTGTIHVADGCVLRLGRKIRKRAARTANVTNSGVRRKVQVNQRRRHRLTGTATHRFARYALEYYCGEMTKAPRVFEYAEPFRRVPSLPLADQFQAMPRPYRDGFIEGVIHFWKEWSAMTDKQFKQAMKLAVSNGWKGPKHSAQWARTKMEREKNKKNV